MFIGKLLPLTFNKKRGNRESDCHIFICGTKIKWTQNDNSLASHPSQLSFSTLIILYGFENKKVSFQLCVDSKAS